MRTILLAVVLLLSVGRVAFADRQLEEAETLQILQQLTSQPKKTWIAAGTIKATHEEYRAPKVTDTGEINEQIDQKIAEYQNNPNKHELTKTLQKMMLDAIPFNVRYKLANEYTMTSTAIVRYDGDRFYWEININSRTDSVKPDKDLEGNFMTEQLNLDWNGKRIFAWDGENYTTYTSANHAVIDSRADTPNIVNGPLTAGLIPWGYGYYSYDNLAAAGSTAVEKIVDGQIQIDLTVNNPSGMHFVLDAAKNYAVLSCSIETVNAHISKQYGNYQLVNDNWVPTTILLERFETGTNRLLASDLWDFVAVDGNTPGVESFDIEFEDDALVEYASSVTEKPAMYRNSVTFDTEALLAERLAYAATEGSQQQNCATAALKYAAAQLGSEITDSQLAELINEQNGQGQTSLLAMKQFAQGLGLYCRAVTTDIETLRNLNNCQVILHIPSQNHFVVLESIDDAYVRVIDLASDKFYYRIDISFFGMDWPEGTALLISNSSITGDFADIADDDLANITGASGYTCTQLLQEYDVSYCQYVGGQCGGNYIIYWQRWGCEAAESGSCSTSRMERLRYCPCIEDPYDPFACKGNGDWYFFYMRACA